MKKMKKKKKEAQEEDKKRSKTKTIGRRSNIFFQHMPGRWIVFFAQSDWFLYLAISCTIHRRAKQDGVPFCFSQGRTFFKQTKSSCHTIPQNQQNLAIKYSKNIYFFYFLAINTLRMSSKCFVYRMMNGFKNLNNRYVKTIMRGICKKNYSSECR